MRAWPLIVRELGEQARQRSLLLVRVLTPLLLLVGAVHLVMHPVYMGGWVVVGGRAVQASNNWAAALQSIDRQGNTLFAALNLVLLAVIWLFGPLVTADCLSRERRQGTLGLLLLTPLTARDVVRAKWMAHALRAAVALLATVPVLLIPILLGGVTPQQVLRAVLLDAASLMLVLSAGLYASIRWQGPRAVHAGALAVAAATAFAWLLGWALIEALLNLELGNLLSAPGWIAGRALERFEKGLGVLSGLFVDPRQFLWIAASSPILSSPNLLFPVVLVGVAWLVSRAALKAATHSVERLFSQDPATTTTPTVLERRLTQAPLLPRWLRTFQSAAQRISPVLALETHTWRLRVAPWLAFLAVGLAEVSWVLAPYAQTPFPVIVLCAVLAVSAAASLQRDRASGALELILTTPNGLRDLLVGKFVSLALLAAPAALLALGMEFALDQHLGRDLPAQVPRIAWMLLTHGTLVATWGLACSLRWSNLALATLITMIVSAVLIVGTQAALTLALTGNLVDLEGLLSRTHLHVAAMTGLAELAFAALFFFQLARSLRSRRFSAHSA